MHSQRVKANLAAYRTPTDDTDPEVVDAKAQAAGTSANRAVELARGLQPGDLGSVCDHEAVTQNLQRLVVGGSTVLTLGLVMLMVTSCASIERTVVAPPEIEGATFVGNRSCADCHTNLTRVFRASPHGRSYKEDLKWASISGCESCHGPGSRHVEAGGGRGRFIVNPGKDPTSCFQCHLETAAQFNLPHHHPIREQRMNCVQCHDPHGTDILKPAGGLAMARLNETCAGCHRDESRPFVYRHDALQEGCTACHTPHGSINPKLLTDRSPNLCLKCHAQVQAVSGRIAIGKYDHTENLMSGTCYSTGCHSAVHGSNVNPKLRY